jgi:hypothetical protein
VIEALLIGVVILPAREITDKTAPANSGAFLCLAMKRN